VYASSVRSRIVDSGVKLAVENHGGDLQAREMKMMTDTVGRDVMGVCLDSGNPVWMLEDPHMTLEMLIPYAETSHVRDSAVWKVPEGIAVRWVNMGEGNVDIDGWIRKFIQAKPGLPIIFENLVSANPRIHRIYDPKFWDNWRHCRPGNSVASRRWPTRALRSLRCRERRGKPPVSSGSRIWNCACATRAICCNESEDRSAGNRGCGPVDAPHPVVSARAVYLGGRAAPIEASPAISQRPLRRTSVCK
jgi:Xylose isomerase-like TIM barrel